MSRWEKVADVHGAVYREKPDDVGGVWAAIVGFFILALIAGGCS